LVGGNTQSRPSGPFLPSIKSTATRWPSVRPAIPARFIPADHSKPHGSDADQDAKRTRTARQRVATSFSRREGGPSRAEPEVRIHLSSEESGANVGGVLGNSPRTARQVVSALGSASSERRRSRAGRKFESISLQSPLTGDDVDGRLPLARNLKFESISLHRRVRELLVPKRRSPQIQAVRVRSGNGAVAAFLHWFAASARKIRSVDGFILP